MEASAPLPRDASGDFSRDGYYVGILLLCLAFAAIGYNPYNISSDAAMYLQCGELLLEGQVPYVDFIDLNPPLIMYLNVIPAWIANATGTHPIAVFNVLVILATAASMLATARILICAGVPEIARTAGWNTAGIAFVTFAYALQSQQGQREHLFVLAYIPFLMMRWARGAGARPPMPAAILMGAAAGLFASLKPHFVFIAAIPELVRLFQRRVPKPWQGAEAWAAIAIVAAYLLHFLVLPQTMGAGWARWFPFVAQHYRVYDAPWAEVLNQPVAWVVVIMAAIIFMVRPLKGEVSWGLAREIAAAMLAAGAMFFYQAKGWTYHVIPMVGLFSQIPAILLNVQLGGEKQPAFEFRMNPRTRHLICMTSAAAALIAGAALLLAATPERKIRSPLAALMRSETRPSDTVLVLSTGVNPGYPALTQARRQPGSRPLWSFAVPMFRAAGEAEAKREGEYAAELAEDIRGRKPALILIEAVECQACPDGFNLREYFESAPEVGELLKDYSEFGMVGGAVVLKRAAAGS